MNLAPLLLALGFGVGITIILLIARNGAKQIAKKKVK